MPIELHCHSHASDGSLSPEKLISYAIDRNISHLCLTDHDSIAGIEATATAARNTSLTFIPGIELDIGHPSGGFHLLGMGITQYWKLSDRILPTIQGDREERNHKIAKKMNSIGIPGGYGDIRHLANGGAVGRPHFAKYLIEKGFASDLGDAFNRFLSQRGSLFVPRQGLDLGEAIDAIHDSGGKAILAHPETLRLSWNRLTDSLRNWMSMGLDGIEAFHASVKYQKGLRYQALARDFSLLCTAGSDFHGPDQKHRKLGHCCLEQHPIGEEFLEGIM